MFDDFVNVPQSKPTIIRQTDKIIMKGFAQSLSFVALLLVLSQGAVSQQMRSDWYGEIGAGVAFQSETDLNQLGIPFSTDYDTGFIVSGAFGRQFPMFRAEGELIYTKSDFDSISLLGVSIPLDGDVSIFGGMVNVYYDFDTGTIWRPFVGVGLGYAQVSVNDASIAGIPLFDDDDAAFAYQFKAGVAYQYNPNTDFLISYRYLGSGDLDFTDPAGFPLSADGIDNHSVQVGVRFRF